ncbi:MAG: hypothetical protein ABSC56_13985 [Solirubrobacteraceae bacterium]
MTAELRHRAETHGARFTLLVPAGSGPAAEPKAYRAAELLRAAGLQVRETVGWRDPAAVVHEAWNPPSCDEILNSAAARRVQSGLPCRVEHLTGALARHVPIGDRVADWRLAA